MRSSEMLSIKIADIVFDQTFMAVFKESCKKDNYRDGSWIMISKTGTCLCPENNVKQYIGWAELKSDDFLFCNLSKKKTGYQIRNDRKVMTYSNLWDLRDRRMRMIYHGAVCTRSGLVARRLPQIMVLRTGCSNVMDIGSVTPQKKKQKKKKKRIYQRQF